MTQSPTTKTSPAAPTKPQPEDFRAQIATLERRSYETYRARLQASIRLEQRARAWNTSLVALAFSTTVASIGMLTSESMYGGSGDVLLVCLGVLALVVSLVTSGLNYSGRSRNMFVNYRKLQAISAQAERAGLNATLHHAGFVERLHARYDAILDESENHSPADHLRLHPGSHRKLAVLREDSLTIFPYLTLAIPAALLIPLLDEMIGLF